MKTETRWKALGLRAQGNWHSKAEAGHGGVQTLQTGIAWHVHESCTGGVKCLTSRVVYRFSKHTREKKGHSVRDHKTTECSEYPLW